MKTCKGYTSTGESGQAYAQGRHDVPSDLFGSKNICKDCYRAYAADWRARTGAGKVSRPRASRSSSGAAQVVIPNFRSEALEQAAAEASGEELVSDEELAGSRSHAFVPSQEVIEVWGAVTNGMRAGHKPANLLFLGPSGSGKTECAQFLAAAAGLPFTKVDSAAMTDPESWFGTREVIAESGTSVTSYRPSSFVLAIEEPGVLLIDELNRSRDEHRNILIPLLDGTRQVTNPLTGDIVKRHKHCVIIGTGNRGVAFTGTYAVDPALMTRMLTLEFDYAPPEAEVQIAVEATGAAKETAELFVRFATETRTRAKADEDFTPISTREVLEACAMVVHGASVETAARVCIMNTASSEGGPASVRSSLETIWTGIRAQPAGGSTVSGAVCGAQHPFNRDANGVPLTCSLSNTLSHSMHQSSNGTSWS